MAEIVRAKAMAEAFAKLLKARTAPPGVKTVGDVTSANPAQFAVFQMSFDDGDERYRVEVRRE